MRQPKSTRTNVPKRTLASLKEDLYKFQMNGDNVRDAKRFHNVIYWNLFDAQVDEVNSFL